MTAPSQTLLPISTRSSAPPPVERAPAAAPPPPAFRAEPAPLTAMPAAPALPPSASDDVAEGSEAETGPSAEDYRIMGVLNRLYVLMEGTEGLVIMDQHAAHERVMFEQMRRSMEQSGVPTQRLLMPLTLQLGPREADLLTRNLDALARLGIEAEAFGPNTFKIEALPTFIRTDDPLAWIDEVIEELRRMSSGASTLRLGEDMIATTVCRHAVKANDSLSIPELEALLRDLLACEMPYCCPHGRPTLIQISHGELERKFGRRAPH